MLCSERYLDPKIKFIFARTGLPDLTHLGERALFGRCTANSSVSSTSAPFRLPGTFKPCKFSYTMIHLASSCDPGVYLFFIIVDSESPFFSSSPFSPSQSPTSRLQNSPTKFPKPVCTKLVVANIYTSSSPAIDMAQTQ